MLMPKFKGMQISANQPKRGHGEFWAYCQRAINGSRLRAKQWGVPHSIDRYTIDELFIDQRWRCAVSGIEFEVPGRHGNWHRHPFGPSLDRIVPMDGYVPGNVRLVCNMVNIAMSEWGADNFYRLVAAMTRRSWVIEDFIQNGAKP